MPILVGVAASKGLRFELGGTATLGRAAGSSIVLADPLVSSRHAEIRRDENGSYRLVDLGATHGTFVNGAKITEVVLADGDVIILGATQLRFEQREPSAVTPSSVSVAEAEHVVQHRLPMARASFAKAADLGLPAEASRDYERLRIAFEIGQALAGRSELSDLLREVLERAFELVPAERGAILLRDTSTGKLAVAVASRRGGGTEGLVLPQSILDEVVTQRVGLVSMDAMLDVRFGSRASVMHEGVRAALSAPMIHADELVGVIYLDARAAGLFGVRDLDVIAAVAGQAALAVRGARLRAAIETQDRIAIVAQVAAGLAHDFANVLTMVLNTAQLIEEDQAVPGESRELAGRIVAVSSHAARITRRLGTMARGGNSEPRSIDLRFFLEETEDLIKQTLGSRVRVTTVLEPGPFPVIADPLELEQILLNLAFNARDAMPNGGQMTIALKRLEVSGQHVARLTVADDGEGMPPEIAARIFEPFFTTKPVGRGTGVGLSVVRRLVTEARGRIDVDSVPGAGTTFRIDWPLTATAPAIDVAPTKPVKGERLLVVDDDEAVRRVMVKVLSNAGYSVLHAASGEEALELATEPGMRALVTDVVLTTGMTGRQLAERARVQHPGLAVLFVSGYTEVEEAEEVTALGSGFLAKPFVARELVAKLQATIRGDLNEAARRRIEMSARFADGPAFLAAYDVSTGSLVVPHRGPPEPVGRGVTIVVRLDDLEREFRMHGRVTESFADSMRVVFDADEDARRELLVSSARGESVPYFRRVEPRYPLRLEVRVRTEAGLVIVTHTQDVSARGLMISTDHRIEPGTRVALRLTFPSRSEPVTLAGRVQSVVRTGARRGIGVEFTFTSNDQRAEVAALIATMVSG